MTNENAKTASKIDLTSKLKPTAVRILKPRMEDGSFVNETIARCKPLDENSMYCNLLQCSHFADTCAIAKNGNRTIGFVSGYILPDNPDTLFIWQVAVAPEARGMSLGKRMMLDILGRSVCSDVEQLHTTITRSNTASQAVFKSLANSLDTSADVQPMFDRERHLGGEHASEYLWVIGPFDNSELQDKRDAA